MYTHVSVYSRTCISDWFADGKHLRQREGWQRWVVQGQTPGQPGYPGPGESVSLTSEASLPSRLNVGFFLSITYASTTYRNVLNTCECELLAPAHRKCVAFSLLMP